MNWIYKINIYVYNCIIRGVLGPILLLTREYYTLSPQWGLIKWNNSPTNLCYTNTGYPWGKLTKAYQIAILYISVILCCLMQFERFKLN